MDDAPKRISERSIRKLDNAEALKHIGILIDQSSDAGYARGAKRAITLLNELEERRIEPDLEVILYYFRANAWSVKAQISGRKVSWEWEQPETQQELLAISSAASHKAFAEIDPIQQCQILTNRANLLNSVGRFVEALEEWDQALKIVPNFAMALGNRGYGLSHYANALYDTGHQSLFLLNAHDSASKASAKNALFDSAYPPEVLLSFSKLAADITQDIDLDNIRSKQRLDGYSLGRSKLENSYRKWCLEHRLFLNPLNDLGAHSIAARDVLTLPSLTEVGLTDRESLLPPIVGFYNQLKQEFVSARFMLFEGTTATGVHLSDRDVLLYDTLDYPSYSFRIERVRTSYRILYSLLDKIGFLINEYWNLGKQLERINFRNIWLLEGKSSLHGQFDSYKNWPLRGLFWLSKDIFDGELKQTTREDARELHEIRNQLEHKYLQVHDMWVFPGIEEDKTSTSFRKAISSTNLEAKSLRIMKIARSALIYLSLAINQEERLREENRPNGLSIPMPLNILNRGRAL